jgi:CheY-like chemotaxis protein
MKVNTADDGYIPKEWFPACRANELWCRSPVGPIYAPVYPQSENAGLGSRSQGERLMDVLVVEDEPLIRKAVAHDLREAGFRIDEAATAKDALALVEEVAAASGPPLVVVTGLHLGPGLDGLALGAEVLRRWPEVGVVYMTCHPDALDGHLLGPREHYIVKPVARETLLHAVRHLMPAWAPGWLAPLAGLGHAAAAALGLAGDQRGS